MEKKVSGVGRDILIVEDEAKIAGILNTTTAILPLLTFPDRIQ
jgi:hypothetical protein